jgi:hypothetical protein
MEVTEHLRQPWSTAHHRSIAARVDGMALQLLILVAASVWIPTGMLAMSSS